MFLPSREGTSFGGILIMTLIFVVMFLVIFMSIAGFTNRSYHETVLQAQDELAFQMAEAGLNYARWRLAHDPDNFTAETRTVTDQQAGDLGTYSLTFEQPPEGGTIVIITSVGETNAQPSREVTLRARYGIPSLARYAYIVNSDVFYTSEIHGPVHANGGIHMNGQSDSIMTSAQSTYTCQPYHGCNPAGSRAGIWGTGEEQELWEFPVVPIDYPSITLDLLEMQAAAQASNTAYGPSNALGYQIVFNNDNTYSIYRVTQGGPTVNSCDYATTNPNSWTCSCQTHDVQTQVLIETKNVPDNGVIYVEDRLWVRGSLDANEHVTVAAGVFPDQSATNVDIIINGSITYNNVFDGTRTFGAVAQRHVLIPWSAAPADLTVNGAFIAQKGKFGRRHYTAQCRDGFDNDGDNRTDLADSQCSSSSDQSEGAGCGSSNAAHVLKTSINTYGMIASNLVPGTAWSSGGTVVSGYQSKVQSYDPNLLYNPPPYFPTTGQYEFISWEELQ